MVRNSDVIVENFRPGVMKRLGLDYEELKKINPGIIYAAISGFGQTGPYSQRAGYDTIGQAMSGIMSVTGWPDSPPTRCGASFADVMAGMNAVIGILAALHYRSATGRGQMIDVALTDSAVVALSSFNQVYLTTGKSPVRMGNGYEASAPGGGYNAKDGYVVMGGGASPKNWTKLCEIMGKPEMITMPDFENNNARVKNRVKLDATMTNCQW
jgi:CoA:oxalate CoA-transferase